MDGQTDQELSELIFRGPGSRCSPKGRTTTPSTSRESTLNDGQHRARAEPPAYVSPAGIEETSKPEHQDRAQGQAPWGRDREQHGRAAAHASAVVRPCLQTHSKARTRVPRIVGTKYHPRLHALGRHGVLLKNRVLADGFLSVGRLPLSPWSSSNLMLTVE